MKMQHRKLIATSAVIVIIATATFAVIVTNAFTLIPGFPASPARYSYAIKFLCNLNNPNTAVLEMGLAPGYYFTDINVHNPSYLIHNDTLLVKFVLATPEPTSQAGTKIPFVPADPTPYALQTVKLGPDAAIRIDCREIISVLFPASAGTVSIQHAKGFVIIYTTKPITAPGLLDVWAEYTTTGVFTCTDQDSFGERICATAPSLEVVQVQRSVFVP